jgi:predicted kinase
LDASRPLVLIVTGGPASGKSTLGPDLARGLGLPYLSKDRFKEALFDTLRYSDRAWSQRLGAASMRLLFDTIAALLEVGQSVAVESNFRPGMSAPEFRSLADRYRCRFVQVLCTAPSRAADALSFSRRALRSVASPFSLCGGSGKPPGRDEPDSRRAGEACETRR